MTKTFYFDENHPFDLVDDFDNFFVNNEEEYFETWLTSSFEVSVMNNKINAVRCTLSNNTATFSIWWYDNYVKPAGKVSCIACPTELLNEFWERIHNPENFQSTEGVWEN